MGIADDFSGDGGNPALLDRNLIIVDHEHQDIFYGAVVMRHGGDIRMRACPGIAGGADDLFPLYEFAMRGHESDGEGTLMPRLRVTIDEQGQLAVGQEVTRLKRETADAQSVVDFIWFHKIYGRG